MERRVELNVCREGSRFLKGRRDQNMNVETAASAGRAFVGRGLDLKEATQEGRCRRRQVSERIRRERLRERGNRQHQQCDDADPVEAAAEA